MTAYLVTYQMIIRFKETFFLFSHSHAYYAMLRLMRISKIIFVLGSKFIWHSLHNIWQNSRFDIKSTANSISRLFQILLIPNSAHSRFCPFQILLIPNSTHSILDWFHFRLILFLAHLIFSSFHFRLIPFMAHSILAHSRFGSFRFWLISKSAIFIFVLFYFLIIPFLHYSFFCSFLLIKNQIAHITQKS